MVQVGVRVHSTGACLRACMLRSSGPVRGRGRVRARARARG
jgi:hypothetical protein